MKYCLLVGLLQHATKVVRPGRTFISRMYNTAARIKELHYYTITLLLQKPLNPTCTGGISFLIVGIVSASSSVITHKPSFIVKLQQMPQAHGSSSLYLNIRVTSWSQQQLSRYAIKQPSSVFLMTNPQGCMTPTPLPSPLAYFLGLTSDLEFF